MASGQMSGFKRFLLWDYPRASWQYDVMVALILAFIFLTPRELFRDRPRGSNIVQLTPEEGANVFWVGPDVLVQIPEADRSRKVESMLRSRFGRPEAVVRLQPIFDGEREIKGYMAFTRP